MTIDRFKAKLPEVLQIPEFNRLFFGQAISQLGDALYYMVFLYMVEHVGKDSGQTGVAGALKQLPYLLFGFHAGVVADRHDRRKVMLATDLGAAGVMFFMLLALIYYKEQPPTGLLLLLGFLAASFSAFFDPARNSAIPMVVPPTQLLSATSISTSVKYGMQLVGPMIPSIAVEVSRLILSTGPVLMVVCGPLVVAALTGGVPFATGVIAVNLLTFLVSAACIYRLPPLRPRGKVEVHEKSIWHENLDALKFVYHEKLLRTATGFSLGINLAIAPIYVGLLAANRQWFNDDVVVFARLQAAFFLGMVVSGVYVFRKGVRHPGFSFSLAALAMGLCVAILSVAKVFTTFVILLFLLGVWAPFALIPITTYLQLSVPNAMRGRVNSAANMLQNILLAAGWIISGSLIQTLGLKHMFSIMGGVITVIAIAGLSLPEFRKATMPTEIA